MHSLFQCTFAMIKHYDCALYDKELQSRVIDTQSNQGPPCWWHSIQKLSS